MEIIFYGERGLVNSIILDMSSDFKKQKQFLKSIKFENNGNKNWIDDIVSFHYIVEPSFAEFGSPDLIIVAEEENGKRHVLFIEAKVCAYNDAAEKLGSGLLPNSYRGIASKLNIQLALKYRFAKNYVLSRKNNSFVENDSDVKTEYRDSKRALKKRSVINLCKNKFGDNPDFLFVALTNDNKDIIPFTDEAFLPAIGTNNWNCDKEKFGVVSYEMLEKSGVVDKKMGYYGQASHGFLYLPANTGAKPGDRRIKTMNMRSWDNNLYVELEIYYKELDKKLVTGKIKKLEGSYSIKSGDGRILVKLFIENKHIQIAFRNDNVQDHLSNGKERITIGVGSSVRSFILVYSEVDQITDEMKQNIFEFVEK